MQIGYSYDAICYKFTGKERDMEREPWRCLPLGSGPAWKKIGSGVIKHPRLRSRVFLSYLLQHPLVGDDWGDANALAAARIGDFACGTGTLLSTAYQRIGLLHEIHGGDPKALHPTMMERGLVGLDVLTVAVHLTAAMLAVSHPDTPFEGECLLTMPYGSHRWGVSVGSLALRKSL
jgi:hypothetical protein